MKPYVAILLVMLILPAHAGGPVQINVRADADCSARIEPGSVDLQSALPGASFVRKEADAGGEQIRSCEIDVPKEQFLGRFQFCALAATTDALCSVSYNFAGGRTVSFTAVGPAPVVCRFACLEK